MEGDQASQKSARRVWRRFARRQEVLDNALWIRVRTQLISFDEAFDDVARVAIEPSTHSSFALEY